MSPRPPQTASYGRCKCNDLKPVMKDGIFCTDHELLWIAHAGYTSNKLKWEHKKLYTQFIKKYRVQGIDIYKELFRMSPSAQQWANDQVEFIKRLDRAHSNHEVTNNVHPTALQSSTENPG